jgi:hypothetical protein
MFCDAAEPMKAADAQAKYSWESDMETPLFLV